MTTSDMNFSNPSDDWSIILQSYPPKLKKELVRRISEIFDLEKKDAEQAISNTPLILLDNLSFGMAARIKNFFQKLGAVVETTNHEMIKKNCFQILWPETPDLSFFLKEETKSASKEASPAVPAKTSKEPEPSAVNPPEAPEREEAPSVMSQQAGQPAPQEPAVPAKDVEERESLARGPAEPVIPKADDEWEKRAQELSKKLEGIPSEVEKAKREHDAKVRQGMPEEIPESAASVSGDADWRSKATLLSERVRNLEDDLIESKESSAQEIEELRSKISAGEDRIRDLEADLAQRVRDAELMGHEKESLNHQAAKVGDLAGQLDALRNALNEKASLVAERENRIAELQDQMKSWMAKVQENERILGERDGSLAALQGQMKDWTHRAQAAEGALAELQDQMKMWTAKVQENERALAEKDGSLTALQEQVRDWTNRAQSAEGTLGEKNQALEAVQNELNAMRERERELLQRADSLQRSVQAMEEDIRTRDEALKARDGILAAFENRVTELATTVREFEPIRAEHAQLVQELGTIRKEYETKIAEMEVRFAKTEDDHRRYRSRADRKIAAATRELGEWVRGVDALRQGLQKLVVFLGSESAVPLTDKKTVVRSPLNRAPEPNDRGQS